VRRAAAAAAAAACRWAAAAANISRATKPQSKVEEGNHQGNLYVVIPSFGSRFKSNLAACDVRPGEATLLGEWL
jgi:hypothetical protein